MSTLIVYASTHGFTEMCAQRLARHLPGEVRTVDLTTHPHPDLTRCPVVVIGGSIHMGRVQPIVGSFCEQNRDALLRRQVALFLSCMKRDEEASQQFDNAFPLRLRAHAFAHAHLGGAFSFERMSTLERFVIQRMTGIRQNIQDLDESAFQAFVERIAQCVIDHGVPVVATTLTAALSARFQSPKPQAPASHD